MKTLKVIVVLTLIFLLIPVANGKKLKGKFKNNGFEFMCAKRIPIKFAPEVDESQIVINSLSYMMKIYISYPYIISNEMSMYLFDDKFTPAKYNKRSAEYFAREFLLNFETPELKSYNDYLVYAQTRSSIYAIVIDVDGKISKISPIEQNLLPEVEKQIIEYFYNSDSWTPAKVLNKDSKSVYMITVTYGHISEDQGEAGWKKDRKTRKK